MERIMSLIDATHIKVFKRTWKDKVLREVISRKIREEMRLSNILSRISF